MTSALPCGMSHVAGLARSFSAESPPSTLNQPAPPASRGIRPIVNRTDRPNRRRSKNPSHHAFSPNPRHQRHLRFLRIQFSSLCGESASSPHQLSFIFHVKRPSQVHDFPPFPGFSRESKLKMTPSSVLALANAPRRRGCRHLTRLLQKGPAIPRISRNSTSLHLHPSPFVVAPNRLIDRSRKYLKFQKIAGNSVNETKNFTNLPRLSSAFLSIRVHLWSNRTVRSPAIYFQHSLSNPHATLLQSAYE